MSKTPEELIDDAFKTTGGYIARDADEWADYIAPILVGLLNVDPDKSSVEFFRKVNSIIASSMPFPVLVKATGRFMEGMAKVNGGGDLDPRVTALRDELKSLVDDLDLFGSKDDKPGS